MLAQTIVKKERFNQKDLKECIGILCDTLTLCLKLNNANPKYAKTHVSAMKANVRIVCCIVICVTVDKLKCV